jgi:hypothetical protein
MIIKLKRENKIETIITSIIIIIMEEIIIIETKVEVGEEKLVGIDIIGREIEIIIEEVRKVIEGGKIIIVIKREKKMKIEVVRNLF